MLTRARPSRFRPATRASPPMSRAAWSRPTGWFHRKLAERHSLEVIEMARETGRRLPARLGEIHVRQRGDGPAAVLWHSLFVDSRSWRRVEDRLAHDRTLIIIDGPAHGQSASPGGRFTLDDCAEAGVELLDALGVHSHDCDHSRNRPSVVSF